MNSAARSPARSLKRRRAIRKTTNTVPVSKRAEMTRPIIVRSYMLESSTPGTAFTTHPTAPRR